MSYQTLLARPPLPAPLYRRAELADAVTWDDLVRAGHLVPLTEDVARHRTVAPTAALRAAALLPWAAGDVVVVDASAAWLHVPGPAAVLTGAAPSGTVVPHRLELHRGPVRLAYARERTRPPRRAGALVRRTGFAPGDVVALTTPAGDRVLVTSTTRTVLDLAGRHEHERAVEVIVALAEAGADLAEAAARVRRAPQWRSREATERALGEASARHAEGSVRPAGAGRGLPRASR